MDTVCPRSVNVTVDIPVENTEPGPLVFQLPETAHEPVVSVNVPLAPPIIVNPEIDTAEAFAARTPALSTAMAPPMRPRLPVASVVAPPPPWTDVRSEDSRIADGDGASDEAKIARSERRRPAPSLDREDSGPSQGVRHHRECDRRRAAVEGHVVELGCVARESGERDRLRRRRVEGHGRGSNRPTRRRGIVRPRATHGPSLGPEDDVGRRRDRYVAGDADPAGRGGERASRHRESGVGGKRARPLREDAA